MAEMQGVSGVPGAPGSTGPQGPPGPGGGGADGYIDGGNFIFFIIFGLLPFLREIF